MPMVKAVMFSSATVIFKKRILVILETKRTNFKMCLLLHNFPRFNQHYNIV